DRALAVADLALAHAVADHLAAAELHLLAVGGEVLLHLDDEIGIGEAHAIARRRPEHAGIVATLDGERHGSAPRRGRGSPDARRGEVMICEQRLQLPARAGITEVPAVGYRGAGEIAQTELIVEGGLRRGLRPVARILKVDLGDRIDDLV